MSTLVPVSLHSPMSGRRRAKAVACLAAVALAVGGAVATVEHVANPPVAQAGIKSFICKIGTECLASAIRFGGHEAANITKHIDRHAAKVFGHHSREIADELDRIADLPDLATHIVKDKLRIFLENEIGLSGGTATSIADGVKFALDLIVF